MEEYHARKLEEVNAVIARAREPITVADAAWLVAMVRRLDGEAKQWDYKYTEATRRCDVAKALAQKLDAELASTRTALAAAVKQLEEAERLNDEYRDALEVYASHKSWHKGEDPQCHDVWYEAENGYTMAERTLHPPKITYVITACSAGNELTARFEDQSVADAVAVALNNANINFRLQEVEGGQA